MTSPAGGSGLLLLTLLLASPPPFSEQTKDIVRQLTPFPTPQRGFKTIASFHERSGRADRALKVYRYALIHDPSDPELRQKIRELERKLGPTVVPPAPGPSPDASAAPQPATSPVPGPGEALALPPAPEPAVDPVSAGPSLPAVPGRAGRLATLLGIADPAGLAHRLEAPGGPDPARAGDRHAVLESLKALKAAVRLFQLHNPRAEPASITLDALRSAGMIPEELSWDGFPALAFEEGEPVFEGFPAAAALEEELAGYRQHLEVVATLRGSDRPGEAYRAAQAMVEAHPRDPEALRQLLSLQAVLGRDYEAVTTARRLATETPGDPAALLALALLSFRTHQDDRSRGLASYLLEVWPGTHHAVSASALLTLLTDRQGPENIFDLLRSGKEVETPVSPGSEPK